MKQTYEEWAKGYTINWTMPLVGEMIYKGVDCRILGVSSCIERDGVFSCKIASVRVIPKNINDNISDSGNGYSVSINFK